MSDLDADATVTKPEPAKSVRGDRYDAFISYHSASSKRAATYLQRELEQVARRSVKDSPVRIFRDATHLTYADLRETLRAQLRASRRLILVLHRSTRESPWVDDEVSYWLTHGGEPDRLILARADADLNLTWNRETSRFAAEERLPASLWGVYTGEPLWIDLSGQRFGGRIAADEGEVARLCATILDRDPTEVLQREIREQRSRRRRLWALLAGVITLAMVAGVAGVLAILSSAEATEQRIEAQAQAQSAEALLTAEDRPDLAINLLLDASARSGGQSVRASMLSVIGGTQRLERLISVASDLGGAAPDDIALSEAGDRLAGWRQTGGQVRLGVWEVGSGRTLLAAPLPDDSSAVTDLALVGDDLAAFCSASGPRLVRLAQDRITTEAGLSKSNCFVDSFRGGALLVGFDDSGAEALVVDAPSGRTRTITDVAFAGSDPLADVVVLGQRAGPMQIVRATLETSTLAAPADVQNGELVSLDEWGRVVVRTIDGRFWRGSAIAESGGEYFPVPAGSLAAAVVGGPFPGYVWVTPDTRLAWSYGPQTVDLSETRAVSQFRPQQREVDLRVSRDGTMLIAMFQTTAEGMAQAAVVDLRTHPDGPSMTSRDPIDWLSGAVEVGRETFVLGRGDGGAHIVDRFGAEEFDGTPLLDPTGRSIVMLGGDSLSLYGSSGESVPLDRGSDARAVAFDGDGGLLAVARPAGPVGVYSTAGEEDLRPVAQADNGQPIATTAFGQVTYTSAPGAVLRNSEASGVSTVLTDSDTSTAQVVMASPDGERALVELTSDAILGGSDPGAAPSLVLVTADGEELDLSEFCPGVASQSLAFLPGPRFTDQLEDAEAQLLVDRLDGAGQPEGVTGPSTLDCATGQPASPAAETVLDYQLDQDRGRIVASNGERVTVTTWTRGQPGSLETMTLPGLDGEVGVRLDEDGTTAVAWRSGQAEVSVFERTDDGWQATHVVGSAIEDLVAAEPSAASGLLVTVGASGQVNLFDLASGRLALRTGMDDMGTTFSGTLTGSVTGVEDGLLRIRLAVDGEDGSREGAVIRVPVSVDRLRALLCEKAPYTAAC